MLDFHAWSTARPTQESDRTADVLEQEIKSVIELEKEQGMFSSSSQPLSFLGRQTFLPFLLMRTYSAPAPSLLMLLYSRKNTSATERLCDSHQACSCCSDWTQWVTDCLLLLCCFAFLATETVSGVLSSQIHPTCLLFDFLVHNRV